MSHCVELGHIITSSSLVSLFFLPLVLTVDYLDVSDPERATLPRFEDIQEAYPKELGSYVQFPQFNLRTQSHKGRNASRIKPAVLFMF